MSDDNDDDALNAQQIRRFVESFRQALIQFRRKHYELGGYLLCAKEDRIFEAWPRTNGAHGDRGYTSWDAFCEPETGYASRTCDQLIQNYRSLNELELDAESLIFSRCMRIGWSKLAVVLRFVNGPRNRYRDGIDSLEVAVSAAELHSEARLVSHLAALRRDRAVDLARQETGNPDLQPEEVGDASQPLTATNPAGFIPYSLRFDNNESLDTFTRAMDIIRARYDQRLSTGRCVSMMALHYLATHARDHEGGAVLDAETAIRLIEDAIGIKLQVAPTPRPLAKKKKALRKRQRSKPQ